MCLPFSIEQTIEARSFQKGYRGAWFRCKIRDISKKNNVTRYMLEYLDFPDEKIHSTKLYQKRQVKDKDLREQEHLMVRPKFPVVYKESQVPDISDILEVVVVVNDAWKVGDLVDWWSDGCFWSGTIREMLGNEKCRIELSPEPFGEGMCYEAPCNDLRPSLAWSPDNGWTVPFPKDGEEGNCCARVIKPVSKGHFAGLTKTLVEPSHTDRFSSSCVTSDEIPGATCGAEEEEQAEEDEEDAEEEDGRASKKLKTGGSTLLNTMVSDTIDAAVLDLEELINRIKWLKGMLTSNSVKSSDSAKSSWKFVDYRASFLPK